MANRYDPFQEMDRWFNSTQRGPASAAMPMDLLRRGDDFIVRIDMPGVDPSTVDVDVEDRTLTVRAQRPAEQGEGIQWLTRERPTGTFARQLTLGYGVASDNISADYEDGVLTLTIPVSESSKPRKVSVNHSGKSKAIDAESTSAKSDA